MSGIVLSPDQLKEFKPDPGIKLTPEDMKDFVPEGGAQKASPASSSPQKRKWSQVPGEALKNALPSLGKTAENIGSSLLHPLDTVEAGVRGLSGGLDLFLKAMDLHPSKLYRHPEEYQKDVAVARSLLHHLSGRYGSEDAIKNTLATDPAGALLDASALLSPASGLLRKAGLPGAVSVADRVTQAPVALAVKGAKKGTQLAGKGVAQVLGKTTGAGAEAVAESVKGRPGFVELMRGGPQEEEDLANKALARLAQLKMERSQKYDAALKDLGNPLLSTEPMARNYVNVMKKMGVAAPGGKTLDFSKSSLGFDEGLPKLEAAHQLFRDAWMKKNVGLQEAVVLKHQVGNLLDSTKPGSRAQMVLTKLVKGIDDVLKQHPGYRKMNLEYQAQSNLISQLEKAFSLKSANRKNIQTILTKMHTHSKRKNDFSRALMEKIDPNGDLAARMRGMMMKPAFRHGMTGTWGTGILTGEGVLGGYGLYGHSVALPGVGLGALALTSPRLVGEAGNLLGKGGRMVGSLAKRSRLPASGLLALLEEEGALTNGQ